MPIAAQAKLPVACAVSRSTGSTRVAAPSLGSSVIGKVTLGAAATSRCRS